MKIHWLLSSLVAAVLSPAVNRAQTLDAVPPPPAADRSAASPGKQSADTAPEGAAELLPPGRLDRPADARDGVPVPNPRSMRLPAHPLSFVDVVVLTHQHAGDEVILTLIQQYGVQRPLGVTEIIALHKEGVSEAVIVAVQQCPGPVLPPQPVAAPPPAAPPSAAPAPLVIREYRYVAPPSVRYYYHPPYRPYPSPRWGFSIHGH